MSEIVSIALSFTAGLGLCAGLYRWFIRPRPANQELRRERDFSESILNSLPGVFYLLNAEGQLLRWNRRTEIVTGYTAHEISKMHALDFVTDDEKPQTASRIEDVFEHGEATMEVGVLCKDGKRIPHFCTGQRIVVDGVPCLIGVGIDITDRKEVERKLQESELQYRTLVDYAPEAIIVFDADKGRFIDANDNALRLFKMDREQLFQVGPKDISPPRQPDGSSTPEFAEAAIQKALAGEETVFDWVHRDSAGKDIECEVRLVRLPSVGRRLVRGSVIDVSERKRAEHKLRQQEEMLAHVSRLSTMGELVAGIAHEVNQPLYSIQNFAKASSNVLNGGLPDLNLLREWNHEIADAARRAGEIIKRLRGFVSRHEPEKAKADINEIVLEAADLIAFEARKSGTQINFQLAPDLAPVAVDRVQMQQVLVNLLKNSLEAMSAEDCGTRIVTVRTLADGAGIEVVVSDTGPGLKSNSEMDFFAPFVTTKPNGMGMGLAISRSIAEAHGGRLWYAPNAAGAEFHLTLPVRQSANVCQQPHSVCG